MDTSLQKMDVYFPDSSGPWPALVYVHGGSWMHRDKSESAMFAQGMTVHGYLVVSINYRLYPAGKFPNMSEDVKCAIRSLRAHPSEYNLDPNCIGAVGVSAGGHLVSLVGTSDENAGWVWGGYCCAGKLDHSCDGRRPAIFADPWKPGHARSVRAIAIDV